MKVLVTGATGFLGGWLVRRLLAEGLDVRILQRSRSRSEELDGLGLDVATGDITDLASVRSACKGIDSVFHLAGLIAYSRAQRGAMERVNVGGTENVIQACETNNVRRLLHLSSVVAVGASFDGRQPLTETSEYNVGHLNLGYFETKRKAELLVRDAAREKRIDAVMINPSTIYGPGDAKKGSRGIQLKVARGKFPFYPPGGVNVVAVEDVIDCILAAWRNASSGERYIVSGENLLLRELFELIAKETGAKPPSVRLPRSAIFAFGKVGDALEMIGKKSPLNTENAWTSVLYHWFDSSKAQRELGLKPRTAAYAIAQSVGWIKEHGLLNH